MTATARPHSFARAFVAAFAVLLGAALVAAPATSTAAPVAPQSATGTAVLAVATADAKSELHKPVRLGAAKINASGSWAFVSATLQAPDGSRFSYAGTPFAEAAANGGKSTMYAGLFRKRGQRWARVDSAVGPTDVAWTGWSEKYGAPSSIFALG
ncbi:hypothetical protein [Gordonia crocea]|uniref:Uncharacterized protein n=1 Tax=Gordonia crocea TaxID=589162 RepID=A0A7I9UXZ1_9ACTN|nr:hypothetical protein [Gordonia crocea]GED97680.1 hypothetical protein nbrc107697_17190 [Gordonia crocea]